MVSLQTFRSCKLCMSLVYQCRVTETSMLCCDINTRPKCFETNRLIGGPFWAGSLQWCCWLTFISHDLHAPKTKHDSMIFKQHLKNRRQHRLIFAWVFSIVMFFWGCFLCKKIVHLWGGAPKKPGRLRRGSCFLYTTSTFQNAKLIFLVKKSGSKGISLGDVVIFLVGLTRVWRS